MQVLLFTQLEHEIFKLLISLSVQKTELSGYKKKQR